MKNIHFKKSPISINDIDNNKTLVSHNIPFGKLSIFYPQMIIHKRDFYENRFLCRKHGICKYMFVQWVNKIEKKLNTKICVLNRHSININTKIFNSADTKKILESFHNRFVVAPPIDKATGNIAVIFKKIYVSGIAKEVGPGSNNITNTYIEINNTSKDEDLKSKFGFENIAMDNHCLPNMYWFLKLHKTPIKARFFAACPKSTIKPLAITLEFWLFNKQINNYNNKWNFYGGTNTFWVVQYNKPVLDTINKLKKRNKAKSISSFDFSTLYPKLL